jgi:PAS domain S-box-containing protein
MGDKLPMANINEQRYRVLIDNAPEVVLIFDVESGRFIDANRAAIVLLKFSLEELLQFGPSDISPVYYQGVSAEDKAQEYIQSALNGGNPAFEWIHIDRNGQEIPCEIRLIRFPPYDKAIVRASIIDLTDKKKMEADLAEREERLKLALRATGLGCYDWHPQENQIHWDKGMHELFGLDPSDPIDRNEFFFQCLHPDDVERLQKDFQIAMDPNSGQLNVDSEYRIIRNGNVVHLSSIGVVIRKENGEVQRIIGTVKDITERIVTQKALQESEARYKSLVQHFPNGVVSLFDQDLRYTLIDGERKSMLGNDPENLIGKRLRDIYPKEIYERDEPAQQLALQGEKSTRIISVDHHYYSVTTLPVRDEAGEIISGLEVSQDITALIETEQKLHQTLEQLQLAIETAELGIWQYDLATDQLQVNDRLLAIYGLEPSSEGFSRAAWRDQVHPEDRERVEQDIAKLFQGHHLTKSVFRTILEDGSIRHIQTAASPIFNEQGELTELVGINIDITSVKENAEALQEREAFLRAIYENSLNAILVVDDTGNLRSFNQAACQILGYPEAELSRMNFTELPITNITDRKGWFREVLVKGKEIGELVISPSGQETRVAQYYIVKVQEDFNMFVLVDITERKKMELSLMESEEKFSKSFHENPTAMILVDLTDKSILDVNKAYTQLTGYRQEEVINIPGKLGFQVIASGAADSLAKGFDLIEKHDRLSSFETSIKNKKGETNSLIVFAEPIDIQNRHLHIISMVDISERKLAEEALRQAKNYAENLIETANVIVVGLDPLGTINIFNKAAQEITGYSQEELAGKNWFETLVPRDRFPQVWDTFTRITKEAELVRIFENPILTKTGEEHIISWQNSVLYDRDEPVGTISFGIDITKRKKIEETLRDREELFHTVFDQQFQFMAILSPEGRILEVNDLPVRVTGVTQEEAIGSYFWEISIWSDLPEWQKIIKNQIRKASQMHKALLAEEMLITKSGEVRWTDAAYTAIRNEKGEVRFILVQATDITERKLAAENLLKAQQELSKLTNRFQVSTHAAQLGIWDWDIENNHLLWDETMVKIYALPKQEHPIDIKSWKSYVLPEDVAFFEKMINWQISNEKAFTTEFRIQRTDGVIRYIKAVASVQRDETGTVLSMIGANWDITQEKEAEQERIRARQLELRNRELEQFAYVASHDLQEPLRTVISFVGLLKRGYQDKLDERANEYIQFVVSASSRMSQLIKGLLEYSRIGANRELTLVNCQALVQQIINDLSSQINSTQATITVDPLPLVKGYETELRMLFQNLISNAIKFRKADQHPLIHVGVQEDKKQWVFSVKDEGIGIDPVYRNQIFVLFQRLHGRDKYEGTGIGLAHCQKIVDLHGGNIWVESEPNKGSTFFFSIAKSEKALD